MCEVEDSGGRKINRKGEDGAGLRRIRKALGKNNWYKERRKFVRTVDGVQKKFGGGAPILKEIKHCSRQAKGAEKEIRETEAVVFVPCTPGGALQRLLQVAEDKFIQGTKLKRIRMVERGGIKLKDLLSSKDPWENEKCERQDCLPCLSCEKKPGIN